MYASLVASKILESLVKAEEETLVATLVMVVRHLITLSREGKEEREKLRLRYLVCESCAKGKLP